MQTPADRNRIAVNLLTARTIPIILAGVVGYATYVLVALCCVNYLLVKHDDKGAAISILFIYFLLFILMTACFLRLVYTTVADPPYVPLGAAALRDRQNYNGRGTKLQDDGIAMGEYRSEVNSGNDSRGVSPGAKDPSDDPDSPGLELFYTKNVFICGNMDGRPIWCSECSNWKPDRTHHDSSSGRCVRKMDHFCPWVGGPVGENNYKFFIQFTGYTALYCFHLLVVMAYYVHKQVVTQGETVNRQFIAILALAAFFGLFTASMAATSLNLAALNLTQVEKLGSKSKVYFLAFFTTVDILSATATFGQITYPLGEDFKPGNCNSNSAQCIESSRNATPLQEVELGRNTRSPTLETRDNTHVRPGNPALRETTEGPKEHLILPTDGTQDMQQLPTQGNGISTKGIQGAEPLLAEETPGSAIGVEKYTTITKRATLRRETLSSRDARATRSFVVLKLQPGENPWDLGPIRQNLETVMGTSFLDSLLPFRRSPCCNHEDDESQFKFGPKVSLLRESLDKNQLLAGAGQLNVDR